MIFRVLISLLLLVFSNKAYAQLPAELDLSALDAIEESLANYPLNIAPEHRFMVVSLASYKLRTMAYDDTQQPILDYPVFAEPDANSNRLGIISLDFQRQLWVDGVGAQQIAVFIDDNDQTSTPFVPVVSSNDFNDNFALDVTLLDTKGDWRKIYLPDTQETGWLQRVADPNPYDWAVDKSLFGGISFAYGWHNAYIFHGHSLVLNFNDSNQVRVRAEQASETFPCSFPEEARETDEDYGHCVPFVDVPPKEVSWRMFYSEDGRLIHAPTNPKGC